MFAQSPDSACGSARTDFKVTYDKTPHSAAQPAPGMARIYFIHDDGPLSQHAIGYPTVKLGMDGAWIGANHRDSFLWIDVPPGQHHLCAMLQSSAFDTIVELAHLTSETGKIYFFRTRLLSTGSAGVLELAPIDSDEGAYLVSRYPMSRSKPGPR